MKVKDVMHKGVDWVSPDTPVAELAKLMRQHDVGSIPIGENNKLIGMVTDRDIVCKGLVQNGFDAHRTTARDVMTEGIHCCREDDDLAKAVRHIGDAEGPQVAGDQHEQAHGRHSQPGRRQQFGDHRSVVGIGQERFGTPPLKLRAIIDIFPLSP